MTAKTYTRKVGLNRGKPRIWLEGAILKDNGFNHGSEWVLEKREDGSLFILRITSTAPKGVRKVAGAADRPIIDINSTKTLQGFEGGQEVVVTVVMQGWLRITRA